MPAQPTDSVLPARPGPHALWVPAGFGVAALVVWLGGLNQQLFVALQPLTSALPDALWAWITDQAGLLSLAAWATLALWTHPAVSTAILLSTPAGLVFVRGLKHLIAAERPQQLLSTDMIHVIGRELTSLSFPSGHTATAFAAASAALYMLPVALRKFWWLPALLLATLVGLSRIAVGAHWPVDVLAGAAIGWLVGLSGALAAHRWPLWRHRRGLLTLAVIGMCAGVARVMLDSGYPSVEVFGRLLGMAAMIAAAYMLIRQLKPATRPGT